MIKLNTIYEQDCIDFMKVLSLEKITVDAIVTSPPYNINKEYGTYKDNKKRAEYLNWIYERAKLSHLILKDNGSFFLNFGGSLIDPTLPFEVVSKFTDAGYKLQNIFHWIKSISFEKDDIGKNNRMHDDCSVGHFKPITSDRFLTDLHEYIFHFTKTGDIRLERKAIGVRYQDKTNIGRWKSATEDQRDRGNVWFIPYSTINERRPHPAVFPEKLPNLCIKVHGVKNGMLVYDPFMGVGNTALACVNLGVDYIGTEIDEEYIKVAHADIEKRKKAKSALGQTQSGPYQTFLDFA